MPKKPSHFRIRNDQNTIQNSEFSSVSYQYSTIKFLHTKMKDIEPHCAVILWFYSPVLQIISFYLPTLPQSDFLKDIRNNFTSCNIIIQKKGCKLTKEKKYLLVYEEKIENKTHRMEIIHETQIHNFCFYFFFLVGSFFVMPARYLFDLIRAIQGNKIFNDTLQQVK